MALGAVALISLVMDHPIYPFFSTDGCYFLFSEKDLLLMDSFLDEIKEARLRRQGGPERIERGIRFWEACQVRLSVIGALPYESQVAQGADEGKARAERKPGACLPSRLCRLL